MSVGGGGRRGSAGRGVNTGGGRRVRMVGRSKVWRLASFVDEGRSEVECSLCPVRIKYVGNTTNIARHLELRHPVEFAALDPSQAGAGRGAGPGGRHHLRHPQQNREEAAICRILAQHREELKKQVGGGAEEQHHHQPVVASPATSPCLVPAPRWSWHTPVEGLQTQEDRSGSSEFSQHNSDDVPITVSPEHFLSEANDQDEATPVPPTPAQQKPESYQLRHNNHLTIVLEALARDESFMDVTLTAQGRSLKAHKSVLSAVSSYFRGVLRDNPCQHPIIIMPRDVRFEELYSIVNYIYKGEMTVAAEDLTSLLKTAEILQVSGLAPSDSSATVNPQTESLPLGNVRSSSNSSSASSTNVPPVTRPARPPKAPSQSLSTPPARPKSIDSMINPADFIDVDMTCVKEEVLSGGEDEKDEPSSKERRTQPPDCSQVVECAQSQDAQQTPECSQTTDSEAKDDDDTSDQVLLGFPTPYEQSFDQPMASTSSHEAEFRSLGVKSDPERDFNSHLSKPNDNPQPLQCPHCDEQYRDVESIDSHLRLKHPSKPSFTCKCGRIFTRQIHHQAHTRMCSSCS
ncbi:protein tramtrack, beta isoform-like isoform X3 [Eriocheir sinensis]|uniref:protein tramtrack, beta isoform-like isoform X3 n=1 Tax=Eriocheir sinensis TaxID=95602 RepID=UPI0021C701AF|nr:protein tramtrack, beta isoform-like isoform X3 [Eriocheir sinensis]